MLTNDDYSDSDSHGVSSGGVDVDDIGNGTTSQRECQMCASQGFTTLSVLLQGFSV